MDYKEIKLEKENGIALLTLSNPKTMNALSSGILAELSEAFDELEKDEDPCLLLS